MLSIPQCIFLRKMHASGKNAWISEILKELKFSNTYIKIAIEMLLKSKSP